MKSLFIFILFSTFNASYGAPVTAEKMVFTLAERDEVVKTENPKGILRILQEISENAYIKDFMSLLNIMGTATSQTPSRPLPVARGVRTQSNSRRVAIPMADSPRTSFEKSLSFDDSIHKISTDEKKSISKEEWAQTLFGERGVLTGVFQVMDQQRKAHNTQSDSAVSTFNGKKLDLKEVFDTLLMGSKKGELGDTGPELPEFLGICNRLSCGDIYKAIDKFRKSEFFSNFQTALGLVQDPNGWETLGKLLSNPELISQFTAGSGMEQIFGSALGEAKKESSKSQAKNSKLLPEDGDFGIDFSEDGEEKTQRKDLPEIDFSVDGPKPETSDYYEEVSKGTNISPDYDNTEEIPVDATPPPPPPSSIFTTTRGIKKPGMTEPGMPDLSFSIDEAAETVVDSSPLTKSVGASGKRIIEIITTTRRPTSTKPTIPTTKPTTKMTAKWTPPTTTRPRTTTRNLRKDSDYYAMYYDDHNQ